MFVRRQTVLFGPEIGRRLDRKYPPGGDCADGEHQRQRQPDGLKRCQGREDELDIEGEGAKGPGGDGSDEDRQQR